MRFSVGQDDGRVTLVVTLSEAKGLFCGGRILRFAQNDRALSDSATVLDESLGQSRLKI